MAASRSPKVIQWVLDTRNLWPEASETRDLDTVASRALDLLTTEERQAVLKYYFVRDAKHTLGSILLKRHVVSSQLGVPWFDVRITRDARTKPVFIMPDGDEPLIFNVTHQAGIVALIAVLNPPRLAVQSPNDNDASAGFAIGVDVVCATERRARDHDMIDHEGWPHYVDMHDEVFSPGEAATLKGMEPSTDKDTRLGYFYALWCLREAYVKMTGEALLAGWLKALDIRGWAPPGREPVGNREGAQGLTLSMGDKSIEDVKVDMRPLLEEYMICACIRKAQDGATVELKEWIVLDVNNLLDTASRAV